MVNKDIIEEVKKRLIEAYDPIDYEDDGKLKFVPPVNTSKSPIII